MIRLMLGLGLFFYACFQPGAAIAAFEFDSVGFRHAKAVNKFSGLTQQAVTVAFRRNNPPPQFFYPASLDLAVGRFERGSDGSSFISFGPSFRPEIGWFKDSLWFFDYGLQPTFVLGSSHFGGKNLGGSVHFTTHVGFGAYFGRQRKASFLLRIQHTSNGRLNEDNPGLDMFGVEFNYGFNPVRNKWRQD